MPWQARDRYPAVIFTGELHPYLRLMSMPSEPDNTKIEELLKAYARKRREQATGSFDMHPAVRTMLQGEVSRQRGPQPNKSRVSLLFRWFPRIGMVGAAVVLLSTVLWNISQPPNLDRFAKAKLSKDQSKNAQAWNYPEE